MVSMRLNKDKVLGMLIGLHVGDCLGIPLEFKKPQHEDAWYNEIVGGGAFGFPPGVGSDDTDLMLCILRSVAENKSFVLHDIAKKLVIWKNTNPLDIGSTTRFGIRNIEKGERLDECGLTYNNSQGNGSIMRCAPLALLPDITDKQIASQAKLTHGHPICVATDIAYVRWLKWLLDGSQESKISIGEYFIAPEHGKDPEDFPPVKAYLEECIGFDWKALPNSGWCVHSLGVAMWAMVNYDNFEDALIAVVNRGDDADTGGAVAGAVLGARYGYEAIPKRWVEKLQSVDEIKELVNKLGVE